LVIYDPDDPHSDLYDVDNGKIAVRFKVGSPLNVFPEEQTVITLADWYHFVSGQAGLVPWVFIPCFPFHAEYSPSLFNSTLINGKGRYVGGPSVALAIVNVEQGIRLVLHFHLWIKVKPNTRQHNSYRLRLISISCDPAYTFSIDGHQLTIIEVDGNNVQPLVVDSLEIFAGTQSRSRYSLHRLAYVSNRSTLLGCCKSI
jgi:iron transport multicopper oxidase